MRLGRDENRSEASFKSSSSPSFLSPLLLCFFSDMCREGRDEDDIDRGRGSHLACCCFYDDGLDAYIAELRYPDSCPHFIMCCLPWTSLISMATTEKPSDF